MKEDLDSFLAEMVDTSHRDMCLAVRDEIRRLDGLPQEQRDAAGHYRAALAGVGFWLTYGAQPDAMDDADFVKLRPFCERFVAAGEMKAHALDAFYVVG
jgi:hypothetical protein